MVFGRIKGAGKHLPGAGLAGTTGTTTPTVTVEYESRSSVVQTHDITGIKHPLTFVNGRVAVSHDLQHIKESIFQIVCTNRGEYLMLPGFGSGLPSRVFDPVNVVALATGDIEEALRVWEKRISVTEVSSEINKDSMGEVDINITFEMKNTEQQESLLVGFGGQ